MVKLREGGSEDFQIQTIGRIRRMPEGKHYGINTLDYCYIYTLDTNYKMGLLSSLDKAYQVRRLFLKDEAKELSLVKELRDLDFEGLGERETLIKVYEYFKKKYNLKWGFVRDESEDLFINNTEYVEDMADEHWVDISEAF